MFAVVPVYSPSFVGSMMYAIRLPSQRWWAAHDSPQKQPLRQRRRSTAIRSNRSWYVHTPGLDNFFRVRNTGLCLYSSVYVVVLCVCVCVPVRLPSPTQAVKKAMKGWKDETEHDFVGSQVPRSWRDIVDGRDGLGRKSVVAWRKEEEGAGAEARRRKQQRLKWERDMQEWLGPQMHRESVEPTVGAAVAMGGAQGRDVVRVRHKDDVQVRHFNDPAHVADDTTGKACGCAPRCLSSYVRHCWRCVVRSWLLLA